MNPLNSSELKQIFLAAGLDPEAETEAQMIAQIESHITQHTQEARIDELEQLYDEAESPEQYDTCEVIHDHRIAQRIQELTDTLKSKTGDK